MYFRRQSVLDNFTCTTIWQPLSIFLDVEFRLLFLYSILYGLIYCAVPLVCLFSIRRVNSRWLPGRQGRFKVYLESFRWGAAWRATPVSNDFHRAKVPGRWGRKCQSERIWPPLDSLRGPAGELLAIVTVMWPVGKQPTNSTGLTLALTSHPPLIHLGWKGLWLSLGDQATEVKVGTSLPTFELCLLLDGWALSVEVEAIWVDDYVSPITDLIWFSAWCRADRHFTCTTLTK